MLKVVITYTDKTSKTIDVDAPNQRDAHKLAKEYGDSTGKVVAKTTIKRGGEVAY